MINTTVFFYYMISIEMFVTIIIIFYIIFNILHNIYIIHITYV